CKSKLGCRRLCGISAVETQYATSLPRRGCGEEPVGQPQGSPYSSTAMRRPAFSIFNFQFSITN
ncbi:MAG: hypothetical protein LBQ70_00260, partial [Prevotellaceae bacterium]|nr:hypothetical protein [Prevotellaceae bacterium]